MNDASPLHPYEQLAARLRQAIETGEIADRLPSLSELCNTSGLSMGAVQRAVRVLKQEGLIYSVHGRGMFVKR